MTEKPRPDGNTIPLFVCLYSSTNPTILEQMLYDVNGTIPEDIAPDVTLMKVERSENNTSMYRAIYRINTRPNRQKHSIVVGKFLDEIFLQFADKYPTYCEPVDMQLPADN